MAFGKTKLTPACPCGAGITWQQWHTTGQCAACCGSQQLTLPTAQQQKRAA